MKTFIEQSLKCPHCDELISLSIDSSLGDQDYYDECPACCNEIHLKLHRDEEHDKLQLFIDADDEQYY